MANVTLSVDANFDDTVMSPLGNGDDITINTGAILTINSDNYWGHNRAVIGNITIDSGTGGKCIIDATRTRWLPFNNGAGNVPVLDTKIVKGAITGSFLGVWSAVSTDPITAGTAMPATGFIKLRDVSGANPGSFTTGQLDNINCQATGPDVVGWLQITGEIQQTITVPRLGELRIVGDWFELGTTNGLENQTLQHYVLSPVPAIWIEMASGSGQYEKWLNAGSRWVSGSLTNDFRAKYFYGNNLGLIQLASRLPNNARFGFLPPAGCKIRVPNITINSRRSATPGWGTNSIGGTTLGNWWDLTTTSAGQIYISNVLGAGFYPSATQAYSVTIKDSGFIGGINIQECATAPILSNVAVGISAANDFASLNVATCYAGGLIYDTFLTRYGANGAFTAAIANSINFTLDKSRFDQFRTNNACRAIAMTNMLTSKITDCSAVGVGFGLITCTNCSISGATYCDIHVGNTTSTNAISMVALTVKCNTITVEEYKPLVSSQTNPYTNLVSINACDNIKVRNIGKMYKPLDLGNQTGVIVTEAGNSSNIKLQRLYCTSSRSGMLTSINSDTNVLIENVWTDANDALGFQCLNSQSRGLSGGATYATGITTSYTSVYGNHFYDTFVSDISGKIGILFNEKTDVEPSASSYSVSAGVAYFTSTGGLKLISQGDTIVYTWPWFILGYTGFQNYPPWFTGTNTNNYTYEYDLDKGSGFSNTWKPLNGTNLSAETGITSGTGFKPKIKISCITENTGNAITGLWFVGKTDIFSMTKQYVLDSVDTSISLTNVISGSRYLVFKTDDNYVISNGTASTLTPTTTISIPYTWQGVDIPVTIRVRYASSTAKYIPFETQGTITSLGLSVYVSQIVDTIAT